MKTFGFQWHLTDRCNLRCGHCYQDDFSPRSEQRLEAQKQTASRIFEALPDRRVSVNLTGGEPLLLPNLFELIRHLESFDNLEEIAIITNGTQASDSQLEELRKIERLRFLKVSIESGDRGINDALRGKGKLDLVLQNCAKMRERTGKKIVFMNTLGRYNIDSIDETIVVAKGIKAAGIVFERFVPLGQGRRLQDQVLDQDQWQKAVETIVRAAGQHMDPWALLPFRAFWLELDPGSADNLQGALCNLGDESMALMPDGTVFPCRRLPIPVGHVLQEPFLEILAGLLRWSIPAMRRQMTSEQCGLCPLENCMGCRALSYALTGGLWEDDPQCFIAKAASIPDDRDA